MSILSFKISKTERDINRQIKYMPYYLIFDFALLTSVLRYYLMPEFGWLHLLFFLIQLFTFTGFWLLIKNINKRLNKVFPFERAPFLRISLQIIITLLIIGPIIGIATYFSRDYIPDFVTEEFIATMIMMVLVVVFMFNFAFYTFHFFENWRNVTTEKAKIEVQAADLEKEKSIVKYHQLKNQVNPHYLFNTLTSLEALIHSNPELASEFVQHMAKVYRYVLRHKESEVVNLYEEVEFIEHYIKLLKIRYAEGIQIETKLSEDTMDRGIVMVTLQMLIDNAIKHNSVQPSKPLKVNIFDDERYLIVNNNKQERKLIQTSNGEGLTQLRELYSYLTKEEIVIEDTEEHYTIKIPLL